MTAHCFITLSRNFSSDHQDCALFYHTISKLFLRSPILRTVLSDYLETFPQITKTAHCFITLSRNFSSDDQDCALFYHTISKLFLRSPDCALFYHTISKLFLRSPRLRTVLSHCLETFPQITKTAHCFITLSRNFPQITKTVHCFITLGRNFSSDHQDCALFYHTISKLFLRSPRLRTVLSHYLDTFPQITKTAHCFITLSRNFSSDHQDCALFYHTISKLFLRSPRLRTVLSHYLETFPQITKTAHCFITPSQNFSSDHQDCALFYHTISKLFFRSPILRTVLSHYLETFPQITKTAHCFITLSRNFSSDHQDCALFYHTISKLFLRSPRLRTVLSHYLETFPQITKTAHCFITLSRNFSSDHQDCALFYHTISKLFLRSPRLRTVLSHYLETFPQITKTAHCFITLSRNFFSDHQDCALFYHTISKLFLRSPRLRTVLSHYLETFPQISKTAHCFITLSRNFSSDHQDCALFYHTISKLFLKSPRLRTVLSHYLETFPQITKTAHCFITLSRNFSSDHQDCALFYHTISKLFLRSPRLRTVLSHYLETFPQITKTAHCFITLSRNFSSDHQDCRLFYHSFFQLSTGL